MPRNARHDFTTGAGILLARLRFFLLLGGVLVLVAGWPYVRQVWDRLTLQNRHDNAVSPDTEYWCPMCPGVLSDWPAKCPVCYMTLVRRQKNDMTPLPDGAVARMQLSPYRVQLAGIRTSMAAYLPLAHDVILSGLVQPLSKGRLLLETEVSEDNSEWIHVGQPLKARTSAADEREFDARIAWRAAKPDTVTMRLAVRIEVANKGETLRPGSFITATLRVPAAASQVWLDHVLGQWRDRLAMALTVGGIAGDATALGLEALISSCIPAAAMAEGLVLAVPETAVVHTGARHIVFVERMPGLFDGVVARVGRRRGDYYPILSGLEAGDRVVAAGAFLLDAETRLNPALAAAYFGSASRDKSSIAAPPPPITSSDVETIIAMQKICPVTKEPLGSMGPPVRVVLDQGKTVYVCCEGCTQALKKNPAKYLANLPAVPKGSHD